MSSRSPDFLLKASFFLAKVVFYSSLEIIELLCTLLGGGNSEGLLLVVVKVGGVPGSLALRDEGRLNLNKFK